MNTWLRELLASHLILAGGVHPARADDVVDSLCRLLDDRHMAVVPNFLSDEMFDAILGLNPHAGYQEKSRDYAVVLAAYRKLENNDKSPVDS